MKGGFLFFLSWDPAKMKQPIYIIVRLSPCHVRRKTTYNTQRIGSAFTASVLGGQKGGGGGVPQSLEVDLNAATYPCYTFLRGFRSVEVLLRFLLRSTSIPIWYYRLLSSLFFAFVPKLYEKAVHVCKPLCKPCPKCMKKQYRRVNRTFI